MSFLPVYQSRQKRRNQAKINASDQCAYAEHAGGLKAVKAPAPRQVPQPVQVHKRRSKAGTENEKPPDKPSGGAAALHHAERNKGKHERIPKAYDQKQPRLGNINRKSGK